MREMFSTVTDTVTKLRTVVRLKPGEMETAVGRSRERYRRIALSSLAAAAARFTSIATALISVPLTLHYLGAERYGMWMMITSVVIIIGPADLGMSNGLVNMIADAFGRQDMDAARRATTSAFCMLSSIALTLLVAATITYPFMPWARFFNVHSAAAIREAGPAMMVFLGCFVVGLPLGVVKGVQNGLQNGFRNSLWTSVGSVLSLVGLLYAIHLHAGLPVLILAMSGVPLLATIGNGMQLFLREHPNLLPQIQHFSKGTSRTLLHTGMMFFALQVGMAIAYQTDNLVIAQILGAGAVAAYAVPAKLFTAITAVLQIVTSPLWPAYTDALARGDGPWIRKTFMRSVVAGAGITLVLVTALVTSGNLILRLWVGSQMQASVALLAAFGLNTLLAAYLQPVGFLLTGLHRLKFQAATIMVMAVLNVSLSIVFVKMYGIVGAILGTLLAQTIVLVIPQTIAVHRIFRQTEG